MVTRRDLGELLNRRVNRVLDVAEAALPPAQFKAFRRIVLDEFGNSGLLGELREQQGSR